MIGSCFFHVDIVEDDILFCQDDLAVFCIICGNAFQRIKRIACRQHAVFCRNDRRRIGLFLCADLDHREGMGRNDHGLIFWHGGFRRFDLDFVRILQRVFRRDAVCIQLLDLHRLSSERGIADIQLHPSVARAVYVHDGEIQIARLIAADQG